MNRWGGVVDRDFDGDGDGDGDGVVFWVVRSAHLLVTNVWPGMAVSYIALEQDNQRRHSQYFITRIRLSRYQGAAVHGRLT